MRKITKSHLFFISVDRMYVCIFSMYYNVLLHYLFMFYDKYYDLILNFNIYLFNFFLVLIASLGLHSLEQDTRTFSVHCAEQTRPPRPSVCMTKEPSGFLLQRVIKKSATGLLLRREKRLDMSVILSAARLVECFSPI